MVEWLKMGPWLTFGASMSSWRNQAFQSRQEVSCSRVCRIRSSGVRRGLGPLSKSGEQTRIRYSVCSLSERNPGQLPRP